MEKVDEKWLKKNGWTCWVDEVKTIEETPYFKNVEHHTVYVKSVGDINDYRKARWDHYFRRSYLITEPGKEVLYGTSNYYMFGAYGDGFHVNNNVSHRKYDSEKIKTSLKLCGIDE